MTLVRTIERTTLPACSLVLLYAFVPAACGGTGDSQVVAIGGPGASSGDDGGGGGSSSGSGSGSGSSSGSSGSSSSGSGSGSGSSSSGSDPDAGPTEGGATCTAPTKVTQGAHISLSVSWPATLSGNAGSGLVDIWLLTKLTAGSGGALSGKAQICGVTLPVDALNGAGQLVTGGSKVLITLPSAVWNAPSMPSFNVSAQSNGWNQGDAITYSPVLSLLGLTLSSPKGSWPSSTWSFPADTKFPDDDGDGKPGITAVPLGNNGYTLPPTGLGLLGSAPQADKIYIALRSELTLTGHWSSCTGIVGTASVTYFDNHVLGCHLGKGGECTTGAANTEGDFVDQSRTLYAPGAAPFVAKNLADGATCSDVLTALPAK